MKRSRGRGRRPHNNNSGGSHSNSYNPNRTFDSSGPEVKIRGSAPHVYEKYLQLARDANSSGDRVTAENYLQHAEHYFRIMASQQAQLQQYQQQQGQQQPNAQANGNGQYHANSSGDQPYPQQGQAQGGPSFSLGENADEAEEEPAE